ncbi:MAG: Zn-dependent alcohol dehydrogenase [Chloroflexi bacterium]|nr:Zn-dependent alcohol dehydrogenase [Chloroflexota bacterium]
MRAAVLYEAKQPLVIEDVDLDGPHAGEVLVRIAASGVCHSDYHVIDGSWSHVALPTVLGHEASGVVEAVGDGVTLVKPGDPIILSFVASCGRCPDCTVGRPHLCTGFRAPATMLPCGAPHLRRGAQPLNHFGRTSSFAEYAVIHESQAVAIRSDMPLDVAALIGCAVMTGVGAVVNTAKVEPGSTVAVFATGGVGLNVIHGAVLAGASQIIAVDLLDNKLAYARRAGATHTINSRSDNPVEAIKALTGGRGVDYAFDAIGTPLVSRQCYDAVRRGGTAVIVGMAPTGAEIPIPGTIPGDEKTVKGSFYGSTRPRVDFPRLVDHFLSGRLPLAQIISRRYPLDEINEAFAALARGENARGVIVMG